MREDEKELQEVELIISKALRTGVIISGIVTFAGLVMYFSTGDSGYPGATYPVTFTEICPTPPASLEIEPPKKLPKPVPKMVSARPVTF